MMKVRKYENNEKMCFVGIAPTYGGAGRVQL
jgi:hypothetical protein